MFVKYEEEKVCCATCVHFYDLYGQQECNHRSVVGMRRMTGNPHYWSTSIKESDHQVENYRPKLCPLN